MWRNYLQLHLVVLAWGLTAILGKLIELPPSAVVAWRTAISVPGFAILAWICGQSLRVDRRGAAWLLGNGVLIGIHWVLFFLAARLSTASVCLAAMPTAMIWCSLMEPLFNGTRKWRLFELVVGAVMVGAVWLIYEVELRYWLGFTVGLGAALVAAVFAVINKQLVARWHYSTIGFYQMIGAFAAAVVCLPIMEPGGGGFASAWPDRSADWLWILFLALFSTLGAYAAYMDVLRRVSVFTVNVIYNMEPIYGIILAVLVFGQEEVMRPGFYAGAAIIVGVVLLVPLFRSKVGAG